MDQRASQLRMPQWRFPIFFILALSAVPAFAQFGGIGFPGMGGRRYPQGQQYPNSDSSQPKVYGPTETLTGSLQQVSDSSLILDAGDDGAGNDRIVLIKIQSGTKYLSTMGKVKASDFEPGDHVTIEAVRDDNDHYFTKTVTMNKKGTPEEKSAAMKAAGPSSSGGGGGDSGDSDPDRPRLHRSNPDNGGSTGGPDGSSAPARQPSVAQPASQPSSQQASTPSSADDPGPPVLHRSAPASASGSSPNPQIASADAPGSARPSLSAEDVNGVTRVPVVPPPSAPAPTGSASDDADVARAPASAYSGGGDPIIDQARDAAFSFSETLPNYVVKQLTNRYATNNGGRGRTSWQPLDIVTSDLIYEDGKERYTNIMVNGKPTKYIEQTGSWSEGEFASMLQAILSPGTNADFRNQRQVTIMNRPSFRYDYTVDQARSTWTLHADGQTISPSYGGSIWIDKATYRVLRIEIAARNLPGDYPLDTAESSIDYDFVMIGEKKVLLPAQADSLSCTRGTSDCSKNHTEFHNYRKFSADTSITFEGDADNK